MIGKFQDFFKNLKAYQLVIGVICTIALLGLSAYYLASYKTSNVYNVDFRALNIDSEGEQYVIELGGISLPKGKYSLAFGYASEAQSDFIAAIDNDVFFRDTLLATNGEVASKLYDYELKMGTDRGRITFISEKDAPIQLAFISIASDQHIYTDGLVWGILAILLIPCMWIALYFFGKSSHKFAILTVLVVCLAQAIPFILVRGLVQGVDTRAHMMRIEGIYYGLLDGQFPVVVQPEFNNSYGQIGVLYPNVFLYVPAVFRVLRMSQLGVAKLYLMLVIGSSGIITFAAARTIFKRDWQVCLCCAALMVDNMKLYDLLMGGKIGGSLLAEMFWPLLVAGLIELLHRNRNKWYLVAYGLAGTICCHVTSATVACIFLALFTLFSITKLAEPAVRKGIARAILLFIGLTLGTVFCFVSFYFGGWGQEVLQWREFLTTLWNIKDPFFDGRWTSVIGLVIVTTTLMIFIAVKDGKDKLKGGFILPTYFSGLILFWMSTAYFPWAYLVKIPAIEYYTNMLQSGSRFLSLAACAIAICIPELLEIVVHRKEGRRSFQSKTLMVVCGIVFIVATINIGSRESHYFAKGVNMLYYDEVVGEVEYAFDDYLPQGTKSEWYESDTGFISDETAVNSLAYERQGTYIYYSYTNSAKGAYVEFPKFYYNGYVAENEMAERVPVYKGDRNRIRVYLEETDTPAIIRIWYNVPWYFTFTSAFSMGLWLVTLILVDSKVFRKIKISGKNTEDYFEVEENDCEKDDLEENCFANNSI